MTRSQSPANVNKEVQGEGDYKSAETYSNGVRTFVESGKVDEAASKAEPTTAQEEREMLDAEQVGISHSKGEDPASPRSPDRKPDAGT